MTRAEKRAERYRLYQIKRERIDGLVPERPFGMERLQSRHAGQRKWGGESGKNLNGAARKYDRARPAYITAAPMWKQLTPDVAVLETQPFAQPVRLSEWRRLLED